MDVDYTRFFSLEPDALRNAPAHLDAIRREGPVVWVEQLKAFAVTRYDDVVEVLSHPDRFSSRLASGPVFAEQTMAAMVKAVTDHPELLELPRLGQTIEGTTVLACADPPEHTRQRALINRAFGTRAVKQLEDNMVGVAATLIDGFADQDSIEFVEAFANPFPVIIIATALGVPTEDHENFRRWSDALSGALGNHNLSTDDIVRLVLTQSAFGDYFEARVEERRQHPTDDLVSAIAHARVGDDQLSMTEMLGMFALMLLGGNETTTHLLGSALRRLAFDQELQDKLRANPGLTDAFVEEVLRLDAPVQGLYREATVDTSVGGVDIPAGTFLWVAFAGANRDEAQFPNPHELNFDRGKCPHVAFGKGIHYCVGAALGRAESRVGIQAMLGRFPQITLGCGPDDIEYDESYVLHGPKALPLRLGR